MDTTDTGMNEMLITLTADIVTAHVANNNVDVAALPALIASVHGALAGLGQPAAPAEAKPEPAVSVRSSVKKDKIICLECGKDMKMLKRHLMTDHALTVDEYRARFGLAADYPMVAPDYSERRRKLAKDIGLGRKPGQKVTRKAPAKAPAKKAAAKK
ncbi:MAG: MucR family transcriptional regulator, partial [Erythrobacter sp.]|nr:MucR family transcriptional regulator [Erythrobacter sp.]